MRPAVLCSVVLSLALSSRPTLARPGPISRLGQAVRSVWQGLRLRREIRLLDLPSPIKRRALRVIGQAVRASLAGGKGGKVWRSACHRVYLHNERGERIGTVRAAKTSDGQIVALRRPDSLRDLRNAVELPTLILVGRDAAGGRDLLQVEMDSSTSGYVRRKRPGRRLESSYARWDRGGFGEVVRLSGRAQAESLKRVGPRNRGYVLQRLSLEQASDRGGASMLSTWLRLGVDGDQALRAASALP